MKRPVITARKSPGLLFGGLVAFVLVAAGCSVDPVSGTEDGPAGGDETTASVGPGGNGTGTPPAPTPTFVGHVSVFGDSVFDEFGAWWLVPDSTLVVRGRLTGIQDRYHRGRTAKDIWELEVTSVILGEAPGSALLVSHFSAEASASGAFGWHRVWSVGDEGIFFLVPLILGPGIASPDVWVAQTGSSGVLIDDLDRWEAALPRAGPVLGAWWAPSRLDLDPVAAALRTELVVEGTIEPGPQVGEIFGWRFVDVTLSDVRVVWEPELLAEEAEEAGQPVPIGSDLTVRVPEGAASALAVGSRVTFQLTTGSMAGIDAAWVPVGGPEGVFTSETAIAALVGQLDSRRAERDSRIISIREANTAALRPLLAELGRIPLPFEEEPEPQPDLFTIYRSPLVIEQAETTITFDKWFFTLLDGTAVVTVVAADGSLLAQGHVEGQDAIMRELPDASFEFIDTNGQVVATITQDELSQAALAALESGPRLPQEP